MYKKHLLCGALISILLLTGCGAPVVESTEMVVEPVVTPLIIDIETEEIPELNMEKLLDYEDVVAWIASLEGSGADEEQLTQWYAAYNNIKKLLLDEELMVMLSTLVYNEADVIEGEQSEMERAAVIWCVMNRVDAGYSIYDATNVAIKDVVTQEEQFAYTDDEYREYIGLVADVLMRWCLEDTGIEVYRILPEEYYYFYVDGEHNFFRNEEDTVWEWSCINPYIQ
ncbi:MAG: hypothetical protein R3Y58_02050 [Eubacteriales bacterium]